jgi:hypothetical protein
MKRTHLILTLVFVAAVVFISCSDKRQPGRIYMPDMAYSRAYEAYAPLPADMHDSTINYVNYPVEGTIRRGDLFPYTGTNDSNGYKSSADLKNPIAFMTGAELGEAQRLFNINCAICHGPNMDAQGPLAVSGKVGGVANLKLDQYLKLPEGTMFHSVTYGKNNMGSYASQLSRQQRWMIIKYIKSEQQKDIDKKAAASTSAPKDSTGTVNKKTTDSTTKKS